MLDSLKTFFPILYSIWDIVKDWWWLSIPFILWPPFSFLWRWTRVEKFLKKNKMILLEIKIPKDVLKPMRAMELVMDGLWQISYDPADWWEKWIEGKIVLSYGFEIVSINGEAHFYIRITESNRDSIESIIFSQYPDVEISVVEDYTKHIPQDIPNKEWDLWGTDYKLLMPNAYPIKTYFDFETEREALEEKRIDPLSTLLESMSKIKQGEQFWVQILASPVIDKEVPWVTEGKKIRDELARRTEKAPVQKPILLEVADVLITGQPAGGPPKEEKKDFLPPEMKLTPGERDVIAAIEKKMAKRGFNCAIRFIYLGKREVFFKPKLRLGLGYFSNFATQNLNFLVPHGQPLITKIKKSWFLPKNLFLKRKLFLRKRSIFRRYKRRDYAFFPRKSRWPSSFILNTEELASLFHFPGRRVAPAPFVKRIESKKGEAPPDLPLD